MKRESANRKDVILYLKKEIESVKSEETKQGLEKTLHYFSAKEVQFQEDWKECMIYAKKLVFGGEKSTPYLKQKNSHKAVFKHLPFHNF